MSEDSVSISSADLRSLSQREYVLFKMCLSLANAVVRLRGALPKDDPAGNSVREEIGLDLDEFLEKAKEFKHV